MIIRMANENDGAAVAAIYAPIVRDTFISFETSAPTADDMSARIGGTIKQFPWLVAEENGLVAGYCYASAHRARPAYRWSCDVSLYVSAGCQRRGVGRRLYERLFDILARQGYAAAFAGIALPNEASVAVHEAHGFKPIGVFPNVGFKGGSWHDVGWWHRPIQNLGDNPSDPVAFRDLPAN